MISRHSLPDNLNFKKLLDTAGTAKKVVTWKCPVRMRRDVYQKSLFECDFSAKQNASFATGEFYLFLINKNNT